MSQSYISSPLRRFVRERARDCCEYCLMPESLTFAPHWIDHIVAVKHGGRTEEENLANACALCNQRKGSDLSSIDPQTGKLEPLFHPRRDRWASHFQIDNGRIEPLTAVGRVTVHLLQLNDPSRIAEREQLVSLGLMNPPQ